MDTWMASSATGTLGSMPALPPYIFPLSSDQTIYAWGAHYGWLDGYNGKVRDSRLELTLDVPTTVALYSYDQMMMYSDGYAHGYDVGVSDRIAENPPAAQPPAGQPPAAQPPAEPACTVEEIQKALNERGATLDVDGDWGAKTQKAYDASGASCAQLVSSCASCPGHYSVSTPGTTTPGTTTPVQYEPPAKRSAGPWIAAAAVAVGLTGAAIYVLWPKTPSPNPEGTRAVRITKAQISMLRDVLEHGYVVGSRAARGAPKLEQMGLIERRSGRYLVTETGIEILRKAG